MADAVKHHKLHCSNVNQRGSKQCREASHFEFIVKPPALDELYKHKIDNLAHARTAATHAAVRLGTKVTVVTYEELLCGSEEWGPNTLPPKVRSQPLSTPRGAVHVALCIVG